MTSGKGQIMETVLVRSLVTKGLGKGGREEGKKEWKKGGRGDEGVEGGINRWSTGYIFRTVEMF